MPKRTQDPEIAVAVEAEVGDRSWIPEAYLPNASAFTDDINPFSTWTWGNYERKVFLIGVCAALFVWGGIKAGEGVFLLAGLLFILGAALASVGLYVFFPSDRVTLPHDA
ncbi:uncharacterized protein LOC62_01G001735 [Vanrija pseudolonga]|uniref:Uncharacterized protein n=1 Tax=Vanrija pseudolonga TaxID=143232 RepID=A0AAF0Y5K6_9TREE|nr:hypothetical protein LOC62_01G001735 [Vanrija pseudolonga]